MPARLLMVGWKAWSVIAAFGYVNTWGDYYERYTFIFVPGLVTGRLFDLGHFKIPYFIASCGLCKHIGNFFLAQGLFTGLFSGIIFSPAISLVSHWFSKKKVVALGITAAGSSLGGTLFGLMEILRFKWTVRVFGFMTLVTLGITNPYIRLPPVNVKGGMFNLSAFRSPAYTLYCISGITCFLGIYTALTYLPSVLQAVGVSTKFSFLLLRCPIANAASGFGRLSAGLLADRIGPLNVMIPFTGLAGILTFAWPYASGQGALIGVSVIYGFASGTYVSLIAAPPMAMGDVGDVGRRGTPISGAINARTGGFKDPGFYAGVDRHTTCARHGTVTQLSWGGEE
ncbi:MFS general substrate transporter [Pisolithus marmoratus]|nr:MFS general substrate transporter [Pisolithus marmoratus]